MRLADFYAEIRGDPRGDWFDGVFVNKAVEMMTGGKYSLTPPRPERRPDPTPEDIAYIDRRLAEFRANLAAAEDAAGRPSRAAPRTRATWRRYKPGSGLAQPKSTEGQRMAKTLRSEVADKFGGAINAGALKSLVDQVARAMEGQKTLADEIKDICAQGDEAGIASKREIRRLAREQLMPPDVLTAQLDRMADLRAALSDYVTTPLGEAAMRAEGEVNGEAWAEGSMAKATGRKPRTLPSSRFHHRGGLAAARARMPPPPWPMRGCTSAKNRRAPRERRLVRARRRDNDRLGLRHAGRPAGFRPFPLGQTAR